MFGDLTAAMVTILALKTGEDKSKGVVSLFNTNARQQKADPNNEYNAKIQNRDNVNYDRIVGAAFMSGNVASTMIRTASTARGCNWRDRG